MRRKMKYLSLISLFFVLIFFCGCCTAPQVNEPDNEVNIRGGRIVQAVVDGDYDEFASAAGERADNSMKNDFDSSRKNLISNFGDFSSFRHFGELETPMFVNLFYAVRFVRTGSRGQKISHEQLMQLVFGKKDDQWQLVGMRFI